MTCVSSWAITPSSSAGESKSRIPRVAHTVVDFCERPIANAFGIRVSITHTRGLGMSACTHSLSTIPCSSGSSLRRSPPSRRSVDSAILSDGEQLLSSSTTATATISPAPASHREEHADEHHVHEAQQEHRQQHARLQSRVLAELRAR